MDKNLSAAEQKILLLADIGIRLNRFPEFAIGHFRLEDDRELYKENPIEIQARNYGEIISETLTERNRTVSAVMSAHAAGKRAGAWLG